MTVRIEPLTGDAARAIVPAVAALRVEIFREFPYLYDGVIAEEVRYLEGMVDRQDSLIVGAYDEDRLIGASTGAPLIHQQESFQAPFEGRGISIEEVFYFGESVLLPEFRGLGLGHAFFDERENHARALPGIHICAFCSVVRPTDHPARPADVRTHERFWRKRGYEIIEDCFAHFAWREVGGEGPIDHPMQFWMRPL